MIEYVNKTIYSIEKIIDLSKVSKIKTEIQIYSDWYQALQELKDLLTNALNEYPESKFTQDMIRVMLAPNNIVESLQKLQAVIKKKETKISPEQIAWDNLTRLEEGLKIYENAKQKFILARNSFEKADL